MFGDNVGSSVDLKIDTFSYKAFPLSASDWCLNETDALIWVLRAAVRDTLVSVQHPSAQSNEFLLLNRLQHVLRPPASLTSVRCPWGIVLSAHPVLKHGPIITQIQASWRTWNTLDNPLYHSSADTWKHGWKWRRAVFKPNLKHSPVWILHDCSYLYIRDG